MKSISYAIIVAAGKGLRTGEKIPKQFAQLDGEPVLLHSIRAFKKAVDEIEIILVLNPEHHEYWNNILERFEVPEHKVVFGGEQRFDSVKNALNVIPDSADSIIAVHDAARPLITEALIQRLMESARHYHAVVPGLTPADSVRLGSPTDNSVTQRTNTYLIQTPQVFRCDWMKKAFHTDYSPEFTDDASVIEKAGRKIIIVEGEKDNFKITFPGDHVQAETILKMRKGNT
jgi:2-C-methyl-D-erythritol 4-phosphate cytidylyltransferase